MSGVKFVLEFKLEVVSLYGMKLLSKLKKACESFSRYTFSINTVFDVLIFSGVCNTLSVKQKAIASIKNHGLTP